MGDVPDMENDERRVRAAVDRERKLLGDALCKMGRAIRQNEMGPGACTAMEAIEALSEDEMRAVANYHAKFSARKEKDHV